MTVRILRIEEMSGTTDVSMHACIYSSIHLSVREIPVIEGNLHDLEGSPVSSQQKSLSTSHHIARRNCQNMRTGIHVDTSPRNRDSPDCNGSLPVRQRIVQHSSQRCQYPKKNPVGVCRGGRNNKGDGVFERGGVTNRPCHILL
jgi:hypothetical protein